MQGEGMRRCAGAPSQSPDFGWNPRTVIFDKGVFALASGQRGCDEASPCEAWQGGFAPHRKSKAKIESSTAAAE
jgi:hypothetical protein